MILSCLGVLVSDRRTDIGQTNKNTNLQKHKPTKTQTYKNMNQQKHKPTKIQTYKNMKQQKHEPMKTLTYENMNLRKLEPTKTQTYKVSNNQKHKSTKTQTFKNMNLLIEEQTYKNTKPTCCLQFPYHYPWLSSSLRNRKTKNKKQNQEESLRYNPIPPIP